MEILPLSDEESAAWERLVEEGREIRAPILAAREARKEANRRAFDSGKYKTPSEEFKRREKAPEAVIEIPVEVKRWVVLRAAGMGFRKAGDTSGASWLMVCDFKNRSEEMRCALTAQVERSRELILTKALSTVEQSLEEGTRVSMPQAQIAIKTLSSLDRDHFGEHAVEKPDVPDKVGGGGFVIRMVEDATKKADERPEAAPKKAIVYENV